MSTISTARVGLDMLGEMPLSPRGQAALDAALARNSGGIAWRTRKAVEARELLALSELAPPGRMRVEHIDVAAELRVVARLDVPAAWRAADGEVHIADHAFIGLIYPENALLAQISGAAFVEILSPRPAFHPAVAALPPFPQVLCMGDLPAATRATEMVLITYEALAMQHIRPEAFEALGVLNVEAAHYWHERLADLPLTRRAFLEAD